MRKLVLTIAMLTFSATANASWVLDLGDGDVSSGVICKVNDVTLLTANADDCTKIGGETTHTITTKKAPAN